MKTAISIPDDVFADAERLARALEKSRSRPYRHALQTSGLTDRVGKLSKAKLGLVLFGFDVVLGR
jgi:hypothetical protein